MSGNHNEVMFDARRLQIAYEKVRDELLSERRGTVGVGPYWAGELASSALSTATAVSALALVRKHAQSDRSSQLNDLIVRGVNWLAVRQNSDGGFGDTDLSHSNIATSMLVVAAMHLAGEERQHAGLVTRTIAYIDRTGGIPALRRRYGVDKTFVVPILTNAALAGMVDWSEVSPLPFEAAVVPQQLYRFLQLPVVSYAIPALVGIGQAKFFHDPPFNPLARVIRNLSISPSLRVLERMQPASGGYLEAVPLTSFVLMSLAATGRANHTVAREGVKFLVDSVRSDGSWPIDTNLATWNTTLALNALSVSDEDIADADFPLGDLVPTLQWVLTCQHRKPHPFTGANPGGWGWSDLSGAVPDADDTPGALLTLAHWLKSPKCRESDRAAILAAAALGVRWLLCLQNRDGGWPTFCRGWGKLPFDRSGTDLTAHAIRALHAWDDYLPADQFRSVGVAPAKVATATRRGFGFLSHTQRPDGSWAPLWFGNQDHPDEENPIYGTSKVLLAYGETGHAREPEARRARGWLLANQNADHGWGGGFLSPEPELGPPSHPVRECHRGSVCSSVEETALAVEALLGCRDSETIEGSLLRGVEWLVDKIERSEHRKCSPIGFYFAKLWYYERLYPLVFTVGALGRATRVLTSSPHSLQPGIPLPT
jgi:squalene-hopene/tetraprenyl-beta-curcumene cyclase